LYFASEDELALQREMCTPGTRVEILKAIIEWATNISASSERLFWLSGQAGSGKTTIAYTVAHHFDPRTGEGSAKVIIGGSFFCSCEFPDTRSASSIIRTLVYQLALHSIAFQAALKAHGRLETVYHGPRSQLMGLLVEPWMQCLPEREANNEPCYVLPIDALDELEGNGGVEFLSTLFDVLNKQDLPGLKFFVTSRSDRGLVDKIQSFANKQIFRLEEVPVGESSKDIKLYLENNLAATKQQIDQLVLDAAGLFIYAATVVKYLRGRVPEEQIDLMEELLSTSPSPSNGPRTAIATLDNLYRQILESYLVDQRDRGDPSVFKDSLAMLHTFICTIERTSVDVAVAILKSDGEHTKIKKGTAEGVLRRLHAVLYVQDGRVMSYHKSFSDFLFDESRSKEFFCNQELVHGRLSIGCFQIMMKQLRFNIANISSSCHMDRDNAALPQSIDANISVCLRYASQSWSSHLILASLEGLKILRDLLHKFLILHVLFWMEVMSLLGQRGRCQVMLRDTQRCMLKVKVSRLHMIPVLVLIRCL
jgi:NACHT domain